MLGTEGDVIEAVSVYIAHASKRTAQLVVGVCAEADTYNAGDERGHVAGGKSRLRTVEQVRNI